MVSSHELARFTSENSGVFVRDEDKSRQQRSSQQFVAPTPISTPRDIITTKDMPHTPPLDKKQCNNSVPTKADSPAITRRPSFTARGLELIFMREPSTDENRPKSWSGCPESALAVTSDTLSRHASTNIIIPSKPSSLTRPSSRFISTRPRIPEEHTEGGDDDENRDSSWWQRQTYCVNCGGLFFISQSMLSCTTGRFCSLDCKTTFQYVGHFQQVMAMRMLGASDATSASADSSSNEKDYEVEDVDFS